MQCSSRRRVGKDAQRTGTERFHLSAQNDALASVGAPAGKALDGCARLEQFPLMFIELGLYRLLRLDGHIKEKEGLVAALVDVKREVGVEAEILVGRVHFPCLRVAQRVGQAIESGRGNRL